MIRANLYYHNNSLWRFTIEGHAGYSAHGSDIICAAISVLVFNTVNAITEFTEEEILIHQMDPQQGLFDCELSKSKSESISEKAEVLLNTMVLGIDTIKETYGENYIQIKKIRR